MQFRRLGGRRGGSSMAHPAKNWRSNRVDNASNVGEDGRQYAILGGVFLQTKLPHMRTDIGGTGTNRWWTGRLRNSFGSNSGSTTS